MRLERLVMSCALVIGTSTRLTTVAFHSARATQRSSSSTLKMSFFDSMRGNFEKAFSSKARSDSSFYTVGITGSSGLLGTAIIDELSKKDTLDGKPIRVVQFKRSESISGNDGGLDQSPGLQTVSWNPYGASPETVVDPNALASMDAVIHLAGENVATGLGPLGFLGIRPWTDAKKDEILKSRVETTQGLAGAIAACDSKADFLVASGVGAYGADFIGEEAVAVDETEDISSSTGFLADVSRKWEAATQGAGKKNRVVNMRMGVVMSKKGGALAKLYPIFFLGGGGNVGSGDQYFSFISARDAARAYVHVLSTPSLSGPVNVCAPAPCTNAQFTVALGKVLGRPTILPLPSFAVSLLFGEMGEEMLLGGVNAVPGKLEKSGFTFDDPTIQEALQSAVDETI